VETLADIDVISGLLQRCCCKWFFVGGERDISFNFL
jgi:hypothetical protein